MHLTDTITLDGVRRTGDGYLTALVRAARTGVQVYRGSEVGRPELASVRVYRPEDEVFSKDALRSFAHRPVTLNHPSVAVTADNWRDHAKGWTGEEVARDGEFIRVPMLLADALAIKIVEGGQRELSMGYTCDVAFEAGTTADGQPYDAIQRNIRANHLAVVSQARGGPELRIGDQGVANRTITVDGLSVELSDKDAQIVERAIAAGKTALETAQGQVTAKDAKIAELAKSVETKDGEIAALKSKLADAELTPAKLDKAVADRARVIADAKAIAPALVTDGKTDAEIRRMAVTAKLGEAAAKLMSDAAIEGAFLALVPARDGRQPDPLATALGNVQTTDAAGQAQQAWAKNRQRLQDAWKTGGKDAEAA